MFVSYLLGSIPFGLLLTRYVQGVDIRTLGSGNIGATNVLRTGNKKIAALTLLLDAGKGALAVYITLWAVPLMMNDLQSPLWVSLANSLGTFHIFFLVCVNAFIVVLGHIFPICLKFKGGKGVATALGALAMLSPMLFLLTLATWLVVAKLFRISSLSALIAFTLLPVYSFFIGPPAVFSVSLCLGGLLVYTHRTNIWRLIQGKESMF